MIGSAPHRILEDARGLTRAREALSYVGEHGPYLDTWWVHGGIPAGAKQKLRCQVEPPMGTNRVWLFVITVPIPTGAWPYPGTGGSGGTARILQTK